MADQPNQAMTLREAVEIDRRLTYTAGELSCSDDTGLSDLEYELRDRARAIVDAAVEAHEARPRGGRLKRGALSLSLIHI